MLRIENLDSGIEMIMNGTMLPKVRQNTISRMWQRARGRVLGSVQMLLSRTRQDRSFQSAVATLCCAVTLVFYKWIVGDEGRLSRSERTAADNEGSDNEGSDHEGSSTNGTELQECGEGAEDPLKPSSFRVNNEKQTPGAEDRLRPSSFRVNNEKQRPQRKGVKLSRAMPSGGTADKQNFN
eukprot:Selendium_serpulae@DN6079_c0_g1_i2.p1